MALAQLGETDAAIAALYAAEKHFATADRWGRSVAIYGRAHALSQAGRCVEARPGVRGIRAFVGKDDPRPPTIARRYAADCRAPASPAPGQPQPEAADRRRRATRRLAVRRAVGAAMASAPPSRHCGSGCEPAPVQTGGENPPAGPATHVVVRVTALAITIATSIPEAAS